MRPVMMFTTVKDRNEIERPNQLALSQTDCFMTHELHSKLGLGCYFQT